MITAGNGPMAAGSGSGMMVPMPIPMLYPTYPPPVAAMSWYPQPSQMQPGMFPGQLPFIEDISR